VCREPPRRWSKCTLTELVSFPRFSGSVTLFVDGEQVGEGRVEQTEPFVFSADETCDVGDEYGSAVTDDYPTVAAAIAPAGQLLAHGA
jgi:hypothetical protein